MRFWNCAAASLVLVAGAIAPVAPMATVAASAAGTDVLPFDFDGDSYVDLAVVVIGEDVGRIGEAGAVQVLYGSRSGPTARDQLWHQNRKGIKGAAEQGDCFGCGGVASGDFDADGHADLAIGVLGEDVGGSFDAGAVQVLSGGPRGLTARDQLWHQGSTGVPGRNEDQDQFGGALAVGDFDGDGHDDLAIGVRSEGIGSAEFAGSVVLLKGSGGGLTASAAQSWNQSSPGVADEPEAYDFFGFGLAVGDFNADARDDLAVSIPHESTPSAPGGGAVQILLGDAGGLTSAGSQFLTSADMGANIFVDASWAVTAGDFDADGRDDLAPGQWPFDKDVARSGADPDYEGGSVAVLYATTGGFDPAAVEWWHLDRADLPGTAAVTGRFGASVASGDVTGDGVADLAIGAPGRTVAGHVDAGAVFLLTGGDSGLRASSTVLTQETTGVPGRAEAQDWFGGALTVAPRHAGSKAWLAVGAEGEAIGSRDDAGTVTVVPWSTAGPVTGQIRRWHQDSAGIKGSAEAADAFGARLG